MSEQSGEVDFALAAFREDGTWQVQEIASPAYDSVDSLSHALRQVARDDVGLYPDEMLSEIARRLGFGELFDDAVGLTSA